MIETFCFDNMINHAGGVDMVKHPSVSLALLRVHHHNLVRIFGELYEVAHIIPQIRLQSLFVLRQLAVIEMVQRLEL